ncbi:MAG: alpha/beta fold hydrolase [Saprospiraceae bacterium]
MKYPIFSILGLVLLLTSCDFFGIDEIEPFFFRTEGADLLVDIDGNTESGVFVIFLHGGPGSGSFAYNQGYFSDKMEEDYAMVFLDQRGNGASQGKYTKEALNTGQISKDVYQLTQFLKAKYGDNISIFLGGHSWGGLTSAHALIHTDIQKEIKGWIEIAGAHDFKKNEIEAVKMFRQFAAEEMAKGNNLDFWEPISERVTQMDTLNITSEDSYYLNRTAFKAQAKFELTEADLTSVRLPYLPGNSEFGVVSGASNLFGQVALNMDANNHELTNRLHEIEIPSLFLWGKYDFVVPPAMGLSAYNLVNTSEKEFVLFETSGHSPMRNEGELLTQKVKEFVELYK